MIITSRRHFLRKALIGSSVVVSLGYLMFSYGRNLLLGLTNSPSVAFGNILNIKDSQLREAKFYKKLENNVAECQLCPHRCITTEGKSGFCRVRKNIAGNLYSMVYGKPCTFDVGPIEKAPLYHFIPGHNRLCVATVGCNLRCKYCHNWHISQRGPGEIREYNMTAEQMVDEAFRRGVRSISFTYTEPTIFYEYMYDISRLATKKGLKVSIVSNGYINPKPLRKLLVYLDAVKIDLKAFSESFYVEVSSARLAPVMQTLKVLKEEGVFFEIVNLVVPTLNDNPDNIRKMCVWIKENLGEDVPLHFSRFVPTYKLTNLPSTPVRTLETAIDIAYDSGLKYVYIGNVPGHKYNSTYCPQCGKRLIHRTHFTVLSNDVEKGSCSFCGHKIQGIW